MTFLHYPVAYGRQLLNHERGRKVKDLKHLIYFEDLLQEANNELVAQGQKEGMKCIGYMCENVPEPLLNLPGCFSARLRAPRTGSIDVGTYYLTSFLCEYSRAILERALEGGYNFLDAVITGNLTQLLCDISPYPENHSLWFGIIFMLFGFLFIALGMFVYMSAEYGCGPKDGLLIAIGKRMPKIPIGIVEMLLFAFITLIGWLLGGTVGIGTVISMIGAGTVMHLFYRIIHFEPRALHHRSISEMLHGR